MVTIAADHVSQINSGPLVKIAPVSILDKFSAVVPVQPFFLSAIPFIESLVHDEKSEPIAQIEKLRRRWIMARADRVASPFLEDAQPPLPDFNRNCRPQRTGVFVETNALDLHRL